MSSIDHHTAQPRVAVIGASGFVGAATAQALEALGAETLPLSAPRLRPRPAVEIHGDDAADLAAMDSMAGALANVTAVVNCAGDPNASSVEEKALVAANGLLPGVVARAVLASGCRRFVHISSAVVQGRNTILDATLTYDSFSAYAVSKRIGEEQVLAIAPSQSVIYRPPSVHGVTRRVTQLTSRIARSPLSSVAGDGHRPTPQVLIENVGSAIAFLALSEEQPPSIVIHPWEELTTEGVLKLLGDREPVHLPMFLASSILALGRAAGRVLPRLRVVVRRVEMIWFGQQQATSWLTDAGWQPPCGRESWKSLGRHLPSGSRSPLDYQKSNQR